MGLSTLAGKPDARIQDHVEKGGGGGGFFTPYESKQLEAAKQHGRPVEKSGNQTKPRRNNLWVETIVNQAVHTE